jgi:uncharacterized phage infection (PIP) family protein YhgE
MRLDNEKIFKSYQRVITESTKGMRKKSQGLEDSIDDFMDQLEEEINKIEDNPTFQRKMYQMLANTTKEYNEFLAMMKQVCQTIDSGAKLLPAEAPQVGEKMDAADTVQDEPAEEEEMEEEEGAEEEEEGQDEFVIAKKDKPAPKKKAPPKKKAKKEEKK